MWARIGQWVAKFLLLPLIKQIGSALYEKFLEYKREQEKKALQQEIKKVTDQIDIEVKKPTEERNDENLRDLHNRLRKLSSDL